MTWRIVWSHAGLTSLQAIPWRQAERVDAAVQRLADRLVYLSFLNPITESKFHETLS